MTAATRYEQAVQRMSHTELLDAFFTCDNSERLAVRREILKRMTHYQDQPLECKHCGQVIAGPDSFGDYSDTATQINCPINKGGRYHAPCYQRNRMEYPETHQLGFVEIGNRDVIDTFDLQSADFGLQVAPDGRVWVCINGVAFLRFKPHRKG